MSELVLRPARLEDEAGVTALSAQIWEGEDYVPDRFHSWLADRSGEFTVAIRNGRLVGFGKLTRLADNEWWLEGLRVHPAFREQGIASQLHRYAIERATTIGSGKLRLATSMHNVAVHTMVAKTGFHKVSEFCLARIDASPHQLPAAGDFIRITADEIPTIDAWLRRSTRFAACGGLFEQRWKWLELRPRLDRLQADGSVYWFHAAGSEEHEGILVVTSGDADTLWLNYLDGTPERLPEMVASLPHLAAQLGHEQLRGKPLTDQALVKALRDAGWRIEPDFGMWVFERTLSPAPPD